MILDLPVWSSSNSPMATICSTLEECESAAFRILESKPIAVGFDTETTMMVNHKLLPIQRDQKDQKVSLIQIAVWINIDGKNNVNLTNDGTHHVYLFQTYRVWMKSKIFPTRLQKILTSKDIIKVGVGIEEDMLHIEDSYGFRTKGYLEIQYITKTLGIPETSLDDLAKRLLKVTNAKIPFRHDQNWDRDLTPDQVLYASVDARLSIETYAAIFTIPTKDLFTMKEDDFDETKEYDFLKDWILLTLSKSSKSIPLSTLIKQIVNSYGPWRNRYTEADRAAKAKDGILHLGSRNKIPYDFDRSEVVKAVTEVDDKTKAKELTQSEIDSLYHDYVKRVGHGLKLGSLAKMIENSYGPWASMDSLNKERCASMALSKLQEQGKVRIQDGKVQI